MEEVEKAYEELNRQLKTRKQRGITGKIVNVKIGSLKDFIPLEKLRNPERAEKQAVCLEIDTPDGYTVKKAMILSPHPNSAIMRFLNQYGDWPKVGQQVRLRFDENSGFWRLEL